MPDSFKHKYVDKITNFNPSTDTLEIDTDSFGIDSSASFAAGKNVKAVKKKLAKQDFDFLYDQKKGGLYFNENGADKGLGDGGIIAILKGAPDLTIQNNDFLWSWLLESETISMTGWKQYKTRKEKQGALWVSSSISR